TRADAGPVGGHTPRDAVAREPLLNVDPVEPRVRGDVHRARQEAQVRTRDIERLVLDAMLVANDVLRTRRDPPGRQSLDGCRRHYQRIDGLVDELAGRVMQSTRELERNRMERLRARECDRRESSAAVAVRRLSERLACQETRRRKDVL